MKALTARARKFMTAALAAVCILFGLLTVWTPLPTGVPLLAIGIVLLVTVSTRARKHLRTARTKWGGLNRGLHFVEERTGRSMSTMLKRTRPLRRKADAHAALQAANKALKRATHRSDAKRR